jgi:hypothetical protein
MEGAGLAAGLDASPHKIFSELQNLDHQASGRPVAISMRDRFFTFSPGKKVVKVIGI